MKLNQLKGILSADRYIVLIGRKELQYRKSNCREMYQQFGEHEVKAIYSFKSQDNAIEISVKSPH